MSYKGQAGENVRPDIPSSDGMEITICNSRNEQVKRFGNIVVVLH